MRHHARQLRHGRGHAIDEDAFIQFEREGEAQLVGQTQGPFEIGAGNQAAAHHTAVGSHTTGAVERRHTVVGNPGERLQIAGRAPRGDEEPHPARMSRAERPDRRTGHLVCPEADERPVHVQENRLYHRL